MKIIHKERIKIINQTILKGFIAINVESFIPPKDCVRPYPLNHLSIQQMCTPFLLPLLYDDSGCCIIYKNKDTLSELVYIHDAASLGFPSHESLIKSGRLVKDSIDLSGLIIPEYYDVMEHIAKVGHSCIAKVGHSCIAKVGHSCIAKVGHSCIAKDGHSCIAKVGHSCIAKDRHPCIAKDRHPCIPHINIEEIILELETLSLENKKKYISIALFSSLYDSIKKKK